MTPPVFVILRIPCYPAFGAFSTVEFHGLSVVRSELYDGARADGVRSAEIQDRIGESLSRNDISGISSSKLSDILKTSVRGRNSWLLRVSIRTSCYGECTNDLRSGSNRPAQTRVSLFQPHRRDPSVAELFFYNCHRAERRGYPYFEKLTDFAKRTSGLVDVTERSGFVEYDAERSVYPLSREVKDCHGADFRSVKIPRSGAV